MESAYGLDIAQNLAETCHPRRTALLVYDMQVGLYWIVAASYLAFGPINAFAMASGLGWGRRLAGADALEPAR